MNNIKQVRRLKDSREKATDKLVAQAVSLVDEYPKEQPLSFENRKKKAAFDQRKILQDYQSQIEKGISYVLAVLNEKEPSQAEKLISWFLNHTEDLTNLNNEGQSLEQLVFPLELLEQIYHVSLTLLENNAIEEAYDVISVCLLFSQSHDQIWFTLGEILERKREYEKALYAFQMAIVLNSENPLSHCHQARLFTLLELWDAALESVEKANILLAKSTLEYTQLRDYCRSLVQIIEDKRETSR